MPGQEHPAEHNQAGHLDADSLRRVLDAQLDGERRHLSPAARERARVARVRRMLAALNDVPAPGCHHAERQA